MKKDLITGLLTKAGFNLVHSGLCYAVKNIESLNNILHNHQSRRVLFDVKLAIKTDSKKDRDSIIDDAIYNLVRISNDYQFDLTQLV